MGAAAGADPELHFPSLPQPAEPIVESERPGVFEELLVATVLTPTSVVRPKVVSRMSELTCFDMFHICFTEFHVSL